MCELWDDIADSENLAQKLVKSQEALQKSIESDQNFLGTYQPVSLPDCAGIHLYHKDCLLGQYNSQNGDFLKCAVCEVTYGIRFGTQPDGTMEWHIENQPLPGFEGSKTIDFSYRFPNGTLPSGQSYTGTSRAAFLPATPRGITVFKMIVVAFRRRLCFTVGQSLTTGKKDTVVWAGVHHKTSPFGGQFGYPDPTYLDRVTAELKVRNIDENTVADASNLPPGFSIEKGSCTPLPY